MSYSEILTIGHSNRTVEDFVQLLQPFSVTRIVDVRSAPYSRFVPHFNREVLQRSLRSAGLRYEYRGRQLGGRPEDPTHYMGRRADYGAMAASPAFNEACSRLRELAHREACVLMCSEAEPLECHRFLLVSRTLVGLGESVSHILPNGSLESHSETEHRLLRVTGFEQRDLWDTADALPDAYERQAERVAFSRNPSPSP